MRTFLTSVTSIALLLCLWVYWTLDGFKTVEPHFAGSCEILTGPGSAEDIQVDHEAGVAFISVADRLARLQGGEPVSGGVAVYDLLAAAPYFEMPSVTGLEDFNPHGLSLFKGKDGLRRLFVINNRFSGEETVELFDIKADNQLAHRRTIRAALFDSPSDLVAVGPDQFYLVNDSGASNWFEQTMEMIGLIQLTKVIFFDGNKATVAIDQFPAAAGINISKDGKTVYIAGTSSKTLEVYRRNVASGTLTFQQAIPLGMAVDNIDVANDGSLWIAGHPKLLSLIAHFTSGGAKPAPSQVYLFPADTANSHELAEPIDLFTSLGSDLSASSVVVEYAGKFYIGGITPTKILRCEPGHPH